MKKELNLRGKVRIEALINKEDTEKYLETKDISLCLHARNKPNPTKLSSKNNFRRQLNQSIKINH